MANKVRKTSKIVRMVSNLSNMDTEISILRYKKKDKAFNMITASKSIETYNTLKWFIDEKRAVIARVQNPFKNRRPFRAILTDLIYTYKHDMYVWHHHLLDLSDAYNFQHFLLNCIQTTRFRKNILKQVSHDNEVTIIYHTLSSHQHRGTCVQCYKYIRSTICEHCSAQHIKPIYLCEGLCNILYHNLNLKVTE
jgi:hypothetical protein